MVVLAVLIGGLLVVTGNFAYVMVINPQEQDVDDEQAQRRERPRGQIQDRNGNILATSVQRQSLYANPRLVPDQPWSMARDLAQILDRSAVEIYDRLTRGGHFIWLSRKLEESQINRLDDLDYPGLDYVPEYERVYPQKIAPRHLPGISGEPWGLASHVLGFVDIDNRGLSGVEQEFDPLLRSGLSPEQEAGNDLPSLQLTIDKTIQHIVEEELSYMAEREDPVNAMVVAMEPETGKVFALANWPAYDPDRLQDYPKSVLRNRAVESTFEPGSTLKAMTLAAGLDQGVYDPQSEFNCPGQIRLPQAGHTINCYARHGDIALPDILVRSCNVGTIKAVEEMDPSTFYNSMRNFGFGNPTGIELPGESGGTLRRPNRWSTLTQPSMAIGQGIATNAVQLTSALGSIVNGGRLMKPLIVKGVTRGGRVVKEREPFQVRRVLSNSAADHIREYLARVVSEGTGQQASSSEYRLAGKTGTAQKANLETGGYHAEKVVASFIGFGPVEDPELAVSVIVDEPQKKRLGGLVAAPVFKRIIERSLDYLERR